MRFLIFPKPLEGRCHSIECQIRFLESSSWICFCFVFDDSDVSHPAQKDHIKNSELYLKGL